MGEKTAMSKEAYIDDFLADVKRRMLRADELETNIELGQVKRQLPGEIYTRIEANGTCTITIKINGGAKHGSFTEV